MTTLARTYVTLAHAINLHHPGFVDGYFGPETWKPTEMRPLSELAHEAATLADEVSTIGDPVRRTFLTGQVRAMETAIALLIGETFPFAEHVRRLYGIEAAHIPEGRFDEAITALKDFLPGDGDITQREHALRDSFEIPQERIGVVVNAVMAEVQKRTHERFSLPDDENLEVQFVTNQPWGAYNWYLGDYHSRIDVNLDLPVRLYTLPDLLAHEAYPGHHTELVIKEKLLCRQEGRDEHTVLLLNAPQVVVEEGIAMHARRMVLSDEELRDWLINDLVALAGLGSVDVIRMLEVNRAKKIFYQARGNAALLLHAENASEVDASAYLQRYSLLKPEEAKKALESLSGFLMRGYIFTYLKGEALLDNLFAKGDVTKRFACLLKEPASPELVRQQLS